ncbi:hypothetical protein [Nostoc sp. UHCC 0252]|uniref:hypothetical protein n=1 Tax=Nostoc sp. UHCC 0252 TaxID=3110241 RepID=UPI002B205D91|nr:hypothetical protein [Nostoc sp. UHCC 0252]MEA5603665.1 hypothetical protein [Nostoc sp. UHCC 0252]
MPVPLNMLGLSGSETQHYQRFVGFRSLTQGYCHPTTEKQEREKLKRISPFFWWAFLISCTRRLEVAATRDKTCLRRLKSLGFVLVRAGGLRLYSRDF